jgi:hypothetical protein
MMKMISLAFDYPFFEHRSKSNTSNSIICPTAIEFFSYILSIHNTVFGPWINYRNYIRYFHDDKARRKIDFFELAKWTYYFLRVALCLIVSTCFTDWFLRNNIAYDDGDNDEPHGWRTAYIQALSYRFSHYCVCFIGELCGQVSGLEFNVNDYRNYSSICQQAKERIDAENRIRRQTEFDVHMQSNDINVNKRKYPMKKSSMKHDDKPNIMICQSTDESNDSSSTR